MANYSVARKFLVAEFLEHLWQCVFSQKITGAAETLQCLRRHRGEPSISHLLPWNTYLDADGIVAMYVQTVKHFSKLSAIL